MQWPVEEVEALRGKKPVSLKDRVVKRGEHVEVITGLRTSQVIIFFIFFCKKTQIYWCKGSS